MNKHAKILTNLLIGFAVLGKLLTKIEILVIFSEKVRNFLNTAILVPYDMHFWYKRILV